MQYPKISLMLLLVALVLVSGCSFPQTQPNLKIEREINLIPELSEKAKGTETKNRVDNQMKITEELGHESEKLAFEGNVLAGESSQFIEFNKPDYQLALESDKLVVLSFYANWCPICKAEDPELREVFDELDTDKVVGFRVNFNDDETDFEEQKLAEEYQIPYQHTRVLIKNKQVVLKSLESWTKERLLEEINKRL